MQVTAWHGGTYGLKVQTGDRDRFFDRGWQDLILELQGQGQAVVTVSPSFWRGCPELRSADIGWWLQQNGLAPWPHGQPPRVVMERIASNRFAVSLPG
jgi:hypothetical protein